MFNNKLTESDAFLELPQSSQNLYFHLNMTADDDGFVNNPRKTQRMIGAAEDDLKMLIMKSFIILFDSGIIVIKHWRMHNLLKSDRYTPSDYIDEKAMLYIKENGAYTLDDQQGKPLKIPNGTQTDTKCITNGTQTETKRNHSIVKDSIDKVSLVKDDGAASATKHDWQTIIDDFKRLCPSLPAVKSLSEERKTNIKARLSEHETALTEIFEKIERSDFLTGRNGKWQATFDWIFKKANYLKIIEGNYDNKIAKGQSWENEAFAKSAYEIKDI